MTLICWSLEKCHFSQKTTCLPLFAAFKTYFKCLCLVYFYVRVTAKKCLMFIFGRYVCMFKRSIDLWLSIRALLQFSFQKSLFQPDLNISSWSETCSLFFQDILLNCNLNCRFKKYVSNNMFVNSLNAEAINVCSFTVTFYVFKIIYLFKNIFIKYFMTVLFK